MTGLQVRVAHARHAENMALIAGSNPTAPQWTAAQFLDMLEPRTEGAPLRRTVLVAEGEGAVLGFAVVSALVAVFPPEAELESIAVAPHVQGRGVGRSLLEAVLAWAARQKAGTLRLEVRAGNQRALRTYREAGFHETGRRPTYYAAPVEDAVLMEQELPG